MPVDDEAEMPFPCPVEALDGRARETWDSWQGRLRTPGAMVAYRYYTTLARVHFWPDASKTDQDIARSINSDWGFIVPHESLFLIVCAARPDAFGNPWYVVVVGGRMGYLPAAHSSDPQEYVDTQRAHVAELGEEVCGHEMGRLPHA